MTENRRSDDSAVVLTENKACSRGRQKTFTKLSWNCKAQPRKMVAGCDKQVNRIQQLRKQAGFFHKIVIIAMDTAIIRSVLTGDRICREEF